MDTPSPLPPPAEPHRPGGSPSPRSNRAGPRGPSTGGFVPPDNEDFDAVARGAQALWLRDRLGAALDRLDDLPRQIVWLRVVEGWEIEVIAEDLGIPPGRVRVLGRQGLAALRADLRGAP